MSNGMILPLYHYGIARQLEILLSIHLDKWQRLDKDLERREAPARLQQAAGKLAPQIVETEVSDPGGEVAEWGETT